jgi:hypothetical protein
MLTRKDVVSRVERHLEGLLTLEGLADWAEQVFRDEEFETPYEDRIAEVLALLRDAVDPHRFRWEEPDFEKILRMLDD